MLNGMQRAFESIRFYKDFKHDLRQRGSLVHLRHMARLAKGSLIKWARRLNIERGIRNMKGRRNYAFKMIAFVGL